MKILIAEDDLLIGDGLCKILKQDKNIVEWVKDGINAQLYIETREFDVIILDIGLPRRSGLEVLRNIRKKNIQAKIILLTARDTTEEIVRGFDEYLADDYVTKPFDIPRLLARIRALHRRSGSDSNSGVIEYKNLSINLSSHNVSLDGKNLNVSPKEFAILSKLISNRGRVFSKEQLLQSLYTWDDEVDSNTVEVHIHHLRKKIGNNIIRTIRGIGYIIDRLDKEDENNENNTNK